MTEQLKKETFDPHLNDAFVVQPEGAGEVEVQLTEVSEERFEGLDCFALVHRIENYAPHIGNTIFP